MTDARTLRRAARTGECPDCGGRLARGGAALACTDCTFRTDIEDTAKILGWIDDA